VIHPEAMFHRFTASSHWYNHSSVLTDTNNASHAAQYVNKRCNIHWMERHVANMEDRREAIKGVGQNT